MRYLITTSLSRVSMWMSEARRWMALKIDRVDQLDDRRGVGGDAVDRQDLLAVLVLLHELDAEVLGRLVEHALGRLGLLEDLVDRRPAPTRTSTGAAERQLDLVDQRARPTGRPSRPRPRRPVGCSGDELVAQHHVDRDLPEQVGLDAELRQLVERQRELLRQRAGALEVFLLAAAALQVLLRHRRSVARSYHPHCAFCSIVNIGMYTDISSVAMMPPMNTSTSGSISDTTRPSRTSMLSS